MEIETLLSYKGLIVIPMNNNSKFASKNNIDEKTVRRIREDDTYQTSLIAIMKIDEA